MLRRLLILLCAAALLLPLGGLADSIVRLNTPAPPAEGEALASPTPAPSPTPIAAPAEETADAAPADAAPAEETAAAAPAESAPRWSDTQPFGIRHGPRETKRVAITMDDCYERAYVRELFELCQEYGVSCTFFPLGDQLKAADAELWRAIAESPCEIGSHTNHHTKMTNTPRSGWTRSWATTTAWSPCGRPSGPTRSGSGSCRRSSGPATGTAMSTWCSGT